MWQCLLNDDDGVCGPICIADQVCCIKKFVNVFDAYNNKFE